jgi:hypothetical protein
VGQVVNTMQPVPAGRTVVARLMAPVGWYTTGGGVREAVTTWTTTIEQDGSWSLDLPASSSYDADSTWYRIEEPGAQHAAVVPDGPGPFQLRDIAIIDPAAAPCCPPPPAGSVGARRLDDLEDVTGADTGSPGQVLTKGGDGLWRPLTPVGGGGGGGYEHTQSTPATVIQVAHGLPWKPAGIRSVDLLGQDVEYDAAAYPVDGVIELAYGAPFAGVIYLS